MAQVGSISEMPTPKSVDVIEHIVSQVIDVIKRMPAGELSLRTLHRDP